MPPETGRQIVPAFVCLWNMTNLFFNQIPANKLYGIFWTGNHRSSDPRYRARCRSWYLGRHQPAGRLRKRQPWCKCARLIKKQREVFGSGYRKKPQNMTRTAALRFRNTQKRSRANKNRIQPTGTPRTRNVSPGRFLFENLSFSQVKSRRKWAKNGAPVERTPER